MTNAMKTATREGKCIYCGETEVIAGYESYDPQEYPDVCVACNQEWLQECWDTRNV